MGTERFGYFIPQWKIYLVKAKRWNTMYLIQHVLIEHEKEAINSATHTFLSLTYV